MTDLVLIIGAGPVGMTMASELTRYGVAIRIVDKAAERTDKSKALVLWSRTLELLDRGGGTSAPFIEAGFKAEAVNFVAGSKVIGRVTMESVQSPYPYGLMLPQSDTERLLEQLLGAQGITVERRVELITFTQREMLWRANGAISENASSTSGVPRSRRISAGGAPERSWRLAALANACDP